MFAFGSDHQHFEINDLMHSRATFTSWIILDFCQKFTLALAFVAGCNCGSDGSDGHGEGLTKPLQDLKSVSGVCGRDQNT